MFAARRLLHGAVANSPRSVPVRSFDVVILADCQHGPSLATPALQHAAPAAGFHAIAKAMDANPAPDLRLISTFGHSDPSPKKRGPNSPRDVCILLCRVGGHPPGDYLARRHEIIHDALRVSNEIIDFSVVARPVIEVQLALRTCRPPHECASSIGQFGMARRFGYPRPRGGCWRRVIAAFFRFAHSRARFAVRCVLYWSLLRTVRPGPWPSLRECPDW
jgi:hypothetical protein